MPLKTLQFVFKGSLSISMYAKPSFRKQTLGLFAHAVTLLSDAEMGEDVVEGFLGSNSAFSCDFSKVSKNEA